MTAVGEVPGRGQRAGTVSLLTDIFSRVLQCPSIGAEDDFFDLGGDSIMAVGLTVEIEEATGVRLPTTALFDAPTVSTLAELLDQEEQAAGPSFIVRLKAGGEGPALFITPGVSGSAIDLLPLARATQASGPIYGLRAPGLAEREIPLDRIEAMVAHYLPLIRDVQPHGPYVLAGYSMGGLTALEIARALMQAGENVALLVLLDTIIHPKDLPLGVKARIWGRRARHHAGRLRELRAGEALPYLISRIRGVLSDFGAGGRARGEARQKRNLHIVPQATQRVIEAGFIAAAHYRRRFYPGTITFIEAVGNHDLPAHPDIIWGRMAQSLVVRPVSGDHLDMIAEHAGALGATLSDCLHAASRAD